MSKVSVTTKTGDGGTTDGPTGNRVPKNDAFIMFVGALDEVTAQLGVCDAHLDDLIGKWINNGRRPGTDEQVHDVTQAGHIIQWIQHKLLDMGAELYTGKAYITEDDIAYLDLFINKYEYNPHGFVIPHGLAASSIHLAKAMVRRAEREGVGCKNPSNFVTEEIVTFLNRLSDALYILALTVEEKPHIMWVTNKEM